MLPPAPRDRAAVAGRHDRRRMRGPDAVAHAGRRTTERESIMGPHAPRRCLAGLAPLLLAACGAMPSHDPVHAATVIPFDLNRDGNIVVAARLNDREALRLMLHTAATDLALTRAAGATLDSLHYDEATRIESWGGGAESRVSHHNRLAVGAIARDDLDVFEDLHSGADTDGKFGLDLFGDRLVRIDFSRRRITVTDALPPDIARYQRLPLVLEDGSPFVEGSCTVAGQRYSTRFMLHSGYAGGVLLDDAFAAASGVDGRIEITETTALTDAFGHRIEVRKGRLPGFALGNASIEDVPVGFFPGAIGRQRVSVVGMAVLSRYDLIFDRAHLALYLAPAS
jgi:hypothetical protein